MLKGCEASGDLVDPVESSLTAISNPASRDVRGDSCNEVEKESETPSLRRIRAAHDILSKKNSLLPGLASHLGQNDASFESIIRGDSMSPAIPAGARLRVRFCSGREFQNGDIVYYSSDDGFIVHRVASLMTWGLGIKSVLTAGDNCLVPDLPVQHGHILGIVIAVQTSSGWRSPGPLVHRSIFHRLVRAVTYGAMTVALIFGEPVARNVQMTLKRIESAIRPSIGQVLRSVRLIPSKRK